MKISRTDKSLVAHWWWTIDRWLLAAVLALMLAGLVMVMAASPAVAHRLGLPGFFFFQKQVFYLLLALAVMFAASCLSPRQVQRIALVMTLAGFALMILAILFGVQVKGATRWIELAGTTIQPSEFVKPVFVLLCAWLFAESAERGEAPGNVLAMLLYAVFITLLVLQPDFGQSALVTLVWATLFFLTGIPLIWIVTLGILAVCGALVSYWLVPHVTARVDRFFDPAAGDTFQVDIALRAFYNGGWFGTGPGEGTVKRVLPDAHSDFIFAVAGEEFGMIACLILVALYGFIAIRVLSHALGEPDTFIRLALAGLVALFAYQALINMGVALSLIPAKGMTLPFVSYGGSSILSVSFAMGVILALTRKRPGRARPGSAWSDARMEAAT